MPARAATSVRFLGAAGTVTGSRFLVEYGPHQLLLEAGLFQGPKKWRKRNWDDLPVSAQKLDAVVVSHAHLDHCGYLPRLWRQGYRGPIFLTPDTANLAAIVLRDSARIQEEDARYAAKKGYSRHDDPQPLYDSRDAEGAIAQCHPVNYGYWQELAGGARVRLLPAGHILGSAIIDLQLPEAKILHSGDLGQGDHPLLVGPHVIPEGPYDAVLVESTYGAREHPEPESDLDEIIRRTVARGGTVLIPAFAVDRTEIILAEINDVMDAGQIPRIPVYVDSPMAIRALQV